VRRTHASLVLLLGVASGTLMLAACSGSSGGDRNESSAAEPSAFTLGGDIEVAFATTADGDVNEPSSPYSPNDIPGSAQAIPNPASLGGYVNQPGAGMPGRSRDLGDVRDLFHTALAAGEVIRLFQAAEGADLDLALLDVDGAELLRSDTGGSVESLTAPASAEYLIEVTAFSGASNYVLTVGQETTVAAVSPASEFVPGELVVRFRENGPRDSAATSALSGRMAAMGLDAVARGARGETLVVARGDEELDTAFRALGIEHLAASLHGLERADRMRAATRRLAKAMRRRADVLSADPNYIRRPAALPSDELYVHQWHYPLIGLPQAWDNVAPDSGVVVAVADTGVIPNHPELQGQLVAGYDFVSNVSMAADGNGCDANPTDPGDGIAASSWHGTHVAGTVAARTSFQGGDDSGVAGVAWNARVMPLRVLGVGGGTDFDLIQALRYAAGLDNACGVLPASPADVINLSLGGPDPSAALEAALVEVRQAGIVVVAAAGNFSTSAPFYPAAYDQVISVSAVDASKRLAPYSNFGSEVDIAAPGGNVAQDLDGDGFGDGVLSISFDAFSPADPYVYGFGQGTSMAAPHVAGVVALMLGVNGALTPTDIDSLLAQGRMSEDIGSSFLFGEGLVDAFAAISAAFETAGGAPPVAAPRLRADPPALNFGSSGTAADVELSNAGGDDRVLTVESTEVATVDGGAWLSVSPASVDAEGLGRYRVDVDRAGLTAGIYSGTLRFVSSENDIEIAVLMQVGTFAAGALDAGRHFVLLVDPDSLETVAAQALNVSNGVYRYRFDDVEPGEYLVFAGTDFDNDLTICDPGEACGAYLTLDQPQRIVFDDDMRALDFGTGFGLSFSPASAGAPRGGFSRAVRRRLY